MNLAQSKAKDLMATITIDVVANDYTEKVDKALKDYRKTAVIPGFRKGKTPMGIINKKYRTSVVVEKVNKLTKKYVYEMNTIGKKTGSFFEGSFFGEDLKFCQEVTSSLNLLIQEHLNSGKN